MEIDYRDRQGWIKGMPRFWVEERAGCIAVVDSEIAKDINRQMDSESKGVIWFKMGEQVPKHYCPTCGKSCGEQWKVSKLLIDKAIKEADKLNKS